MTKKLWASLLSALFICGGAFAQLGDLEFEGSNSLRWENGAEVDPGADFLNNPYPDNTLSRRFVENQLRMDLYGDGFRIGGRLLYFKPSDIDRQEYGLENESRFDKRYIEGNFNFVTLRAGTFSDLWGYGLALSLFENRDLYFDSELDGIRTNIEAGPLRLTGLSGTTSENTYIPQEPVEITAGRVELGGSAGSLAFNYVLNDSGFFREAHTASIDWNISKGIATLYGEQAWRDTKLGVDAGDEDIIKFGKAWFWGMNLSKWNWSLLFEYSNYDFGDVSPIQNPPATYRELGPRLLQGREPHFLNIPNEVGFQIELAGSLTEDVYTTFHYNLSSRHEINSEGESVDNSIPIPTLKQRDAPFWEFFGNAEWYLPGDRTAYLEIGANEEALLRWQNRMWAHAKYTTPFRGDQELEFEIEQLMITEHIDDKDQNFHDQMFSIGWFPNGNFSLAAIYLLSDDDELKDKEGDNWPSLESAITFGGGRHRMILFYGRERGGLKCSNGVCRVVQAFSGIRLSLETAL